MKKEILSTIDNIHKNIKGTILLPAEWEQQSSLLLVLPHKNSDWLSYLDEALFAYKEFIKAASPYQHCTILCDNIKKAKKLLIGISNITLIEMSTNDTWVRDFGAIDIKNNKNIISYDFEFNARGKKFDYTLDNIVNQNLHQSGYIKNLTKKIPFVLEGGSIDSNGEGVLLTTSRCLLEKNRNPSLNKDEIDIVLKKIFGLKQIIWLDYGFLEGDDTDSHIDTLARFISKDTIVYTTCKDKNDKHFDELKKMETQLKNTRYNLISLPLPNAVFYDNKRLAATYTNFVFINNAVLVPMYNGNDENNLKVLEIFKSALPNHKIIGVDASVIIRQGGSWHCSTMNKFKLLS